MTTLTELQEMRAALVVARGSGTLKTTFRSGGTERTVEYRSGADLSAAIAAIDRDIAALSGARVREFYPVLHKGI